MFSQRYYDLIDKLVSFGFITYEEATRMVDEGVDKHEIVKMGFISFYNDELIYGATGHLIGYQPIKPPNSIRNDWVIFIPPSEYDVNKPPESGNLPKGTKCHMFFEPIGRNFLHKQENVLRMIQPKVVALVRDLDTRFTEGEDIEHEDAFFYVWEPVHQLLKKQYRRKDSSS